MDFPELKTKNEADLKQLLANARDEYRSFKFRVRGGELKQFNKLKNIKIEIARIMTLLNSEKNTKKQ